MCYASLTGGQKARVVFTDISLMEPDVLILVNYSKNNNYCYIVEVYKYCNLIGLLECNIRQYCTVSKVIAFQSK